MWGHRLVTIILSNLNWFGLENFFSVKYLGKLVVKLLLKLPQHLVPCETLMSAKHINDKLQGSVATSLRCDGVVDNQIKKTFIADTLYM